MVDLKLCVFSDFNFLTMERQSSVSNKFENIKLSYISPVKEFNNNENLSYFGEGMSSEKPKHGQDAHRDRGLAVKNTDLKVGKLTRFN